MYNRTGRFAGTKVFPGFGEGCSWHSPRAFSGRKTRGKVREAWVFIWKGKKMLQTDSVKQLEDFMQEGSFAAI